MAVTHFQDDGQLVVGATTLDKVVETNASIGNRPEYTDITRSGDTARVQVSQLPSAGEVTITVRLYDEDGISSDVKSLRVGDTLTTNVSLKLRPEGATAGLPEQIWPAMSLTQKDVQYAAGAARPPVSATLTFSGFSGTEEPEWTAIPA